MAAPEMEVIKEIPGYKVILKAVLKSQIQQLVESLATHTDEESVILTASVSDGTLSHLGSDSGKNFLEDHEDIKSQFLGFCLRKHHKKKQQEKEQKEREEAMRNMPVTPTRPTPPRSYSIRSPRFPSPRQQGVFPLAMHRATRPMQPGSMRHEPYPRPMKRPLNFDPNARGGAQLPVRMPMPGQVIKIEPDDLEGSDSNPAPATPSADNAQDTSVPSSPSQNPSDIQPGSVKSERTDRDDDARSNSSSSTIPNEAAEMKQSDNIPPEGLSLDSDLSSLLPLGEDSMAQASTSGAASQGASSDTDPNVNVKLEAISESEMELEITGVELAPRTPGTPQESWGPGTSGATGYGSPAGSQAGQQQQGYNIQGFSLVQSGQPIQNSGYMSDYFIQSESSLTDTGSHDSCHGNSIENSADGQSSQTAKGTGGLFECNICGKVLSGKRSFTRHMDVHSGDKPFKCDLCEYRTNRKDSLKQHKFIRHVLKE